MKKSILLILLMALLAPWTGLKADELTVNDGTATNLYVPLYGYYADTSGKSQFIVPSDKASDMEGGSISGLSFYAASDYAFSAIWEVRLLETDETSVSSSFVDVSSASLVYTGVITITNGVASITFDEAFEYGGNNLLIEISLKTTGNCSSNSDPYWYGVSTGTSRGGSGSYPSSRNFLPKTTFTYVAAETGSCSKPGSLDVSNVQAFSAQLDWTEKGSATAWQICINDDETNLIDATEHPFPLSGLSASTAYRVKVRAYCGEEQREWTDWSTAKNFTTTLACPYDITNLELAEASTTSASINLEETAGLAEGVQVQYSLSSDFPENETTVTLAPNAGEIDFKEGGGTVYLEELSPATTYYFHARAYCEDVDDYGNWSATFSFTTECDAKPLPYSEDFNAYSGSNYTSAPSAYPNDELPLCWSFLNRSTGSSTFPQAFITSSSGYPVSGNCLFFKSSNSTPIYAVLPEFTENISALELKFTYRNEGISTKNGTLYAGYLTNPSDASTFVSVLECTQTTTLSEQEATFEAAPAGSAIAFKYMGGTDNNYYLSIDNVSVRLLPTCTKPASIEDATDITASSATFAWTAGGEETNFEYVIVPAGEEPDWSSPNAVNGASTVTVSAGLLPNTAYDFYVRANCGNEETQKSDPLSTSFRTACAPYDAATWADGFEEGIYCWTVGNQQSTNESYIPSIVSSYYAKTGEHALKLNAYKSTYNSTNADSAYAILPEMTFGEGGVSKYTLALSARAGGSDSYYNNHLYVGVVTDPSDIRTFTVVKDIETTTTYADYEIDLAGYTGEGQRIALLAVIPSETNSYLYGQFYVDDMRTFRTPTCQPLASIAVSDIARRSMIVHLTPKAGTDLADAHELVISKNEELDEAELEAAVNKIAINDTDAYEINGLDRETLYYIYVRANCGSENGKSAWVSTSAQTKALSACDPIQIGSDINTAYTIPVNNYYVYSYSQQIFDASELQIGKIGAISFQYAYSTAMTKATDVTIYMGITDKATFSGTSDWVALSELTQVYQGALNCSQGWNEFTLDTPFNYDGSGNLVLAVHDNTSAYDGSSYKFYTTSGSANKTLYYQDDNTPCPANAPVVGTLGSYRNNVKFSFCYELPACPAVSELTAAVLGTGTTQEKISWAISDADYLSGFDMIVSETELDAEALAADPEITYSNIQGLSKDLNGLTPSTDYYVYLRAICQAEEHNEGNSDWASVHFKTLANCPAVINLALALGATDSITATWERATLEQAKAFKYILSDVRLDKENITAALSDVNDTVVAFNGLNHAQKYYFYVASACDEAVSSFVEDSIETLPACQAVENLAVARVEHNLVELTWTSAQFASETQWKVGIVGDPVPAQTVSERKAILFGLSAENDYEAYVIALCGDESVSDSVKLAFNTAAQPGACKQIGEGTSTEYGPVCAFYGYERNGYIFTAEEGLTSSGKILSLGWTGNSAATIPAKIYMKNTTETAFETSKSWNDLIADATLVLDASVVTANGTYEVDIEDFDFTGDNLMILVASNYGGNGGATVNSKYFNASGSAAHIYARKDGSIDDNNAISSFSTKGTNNHLPNTQFCFEPKAVPDVTALAVSDITTNSAKASWEPMGSETAWNVFISKDVAVTDFSDLSAYNVEHVETLSKSFTGLADDTDYFVYVQPAVDGAGFVGTNFRTIASCLIQTNPAFVAEYITAHTARVTWIDPNAVKAGNYKVVYAKADDEFDLEDADLAFVNVPDTFADLSGLQADTVYNFAVMANCGDEDDSRYSVVAQFQTLESCFTPTAPVVVVESINAHSATVAWTDAHDDAAYIVAYGPYATFDINDSTTYETKKNVTDTFVVLDNLDSATRYAFRVKGDCSSVGEGESKNWSTSMNFYTACEAYALPFSENFENENQFNLCWTKGNVQDPNNSSYIPYRSSSAAANGSSNGLYMNAYVYSWTPIEADSAYAVLPELAFGEESITDYQISFNAKAYTTSYGDYYPHLKIGVADDDALTNLQIIADTALSTDAFQEIELSFAPYIGTGKRIVLLATVDPNSTATSRYGRIYVDDIYVSKLSDCKRPASIEVSNITETSASFAWVAGGEETDFEYVIVASGATPDWSAAVPVNDANSVEVTEGLSASTAYDFYVRANCGEDKKSDARSLTFRTACGVTVVTHDIPFVEGFEDTDFAPACWETVSYDNGTYNYNWTRSTSNVYNGSASAYSGFYGPIYLILPQLEIANEGEQARLTFYSYNTWVSSYDKNSVVLMGEGDTEQELWSPESVSQAWVGDTVDLTAYKGQTIQLAFKYEGTNAHGWYIDDVKVEIVKTTPLGIDNVGLESEQAVKFIKDDRIYILRNGILYDVTGRLIRK